MEKITINDIANSKNFDVTIQKMSTAINTPVQILDINFAPLKKELKSLFVNYEIKDTDTKMKYEKEITEALKAAEIKKGIKEIRVFDKLILKAFPIIIEEELLGYGVVGPIRLFKEARDEDKTILISEIGCSDKNSRDIISSLCVCTPENIFTYADFVSTLIHILFDVPGSAVACESNVNSSASVTESTHALNSLFKRELVQLKNTVEAVNDIKFIATNTKILGFNASIEAARAKESGKGFGVIAQEIRNISDSSANSAKKIEKVSKELKKISGEVEEHLAVISKAVGVSEE